ncbi:thioredoxin-disulfide reductase [Anaerosporobacter faecicola]|uniref:thioredoxin-disulfide reductase n=1 Tax=Anaerosporobacter faecicola TaxID=2718714 RepID=UPI00143BF102|nr:thioredoxin-disulfide reductase [Anaerosporobacter faecicola]
MANGENMYDLIILGAGSAGLSAGIYAGRGLLKTLILENHQVGGQAATTEDIANYPGFETISGPDLMEKMRSQAQVCGAKITCGDVTKVDLTGEIKQVEADGVIYKSYAVIIATGASPKQLGFEGEMEFKGRGVGYCATCDGFFFEGKDIFVIGGGDSSAKESLYLTKFGKKVTMIVRKDVLRCAQLTAQKVMNHPKIEVKFNTEIQRVYGEQLMEGAVFYNNKTKETWEYKVSPEDKSFGVFVFVGYNPATEMFAKEIKLDENGYILTDEHFMTNIEGVFAAGDVIQKDLRQIVTATADGARAAVNAEEYIVEYKESHGIKENLEPDTFHEEAAQQSSNDKSTTQQSTTQNSSKWITDDMIAQVKNVFDKLTKKATLVVMTDKVDDKYKELQELVQELAALSDKLDVIESVGGEDSSLTEKVNATDFPLLALLDEAGEYTGVKFLGIPSGHEFNSLVLDLYNLAGPGQMVESETKEKIQSISKRTKIQVAVSLSCHFCPEVVVAAHRLAMLNKNIESEMVDIGMFPKVREQYQIMSVPAIIINDEQPVFGSKKIEQIVAMIQKGQE